MAVYVSGLVLVTAAVELLIAVVIAARATGVPSASSEFWPIYFGVIIVLVAAGGLLIPRGLRELRTDSTAEPARADGSAP